MIVVGGLALLSLYGKMGFGLGDAGLVATPFLPMVTLPLVFAGVILGVLAAVLTLLIFLVVMPASVTMSPS